MTTKRHTGWQRIWNATGYSIDGIKSAWQNEAAFRQELAIVLVMLPVAFWLGTTLTQRALLIFSLLVVLVVELLNSAIETTIDRIGPEQHQLSGQAKDIGSAAVMVSIISSTIVWVMVAWENFA